MVGCGGGWGLQLVTIYLSDTTVDTAGTLLESHTVSGTGATGGPWVKSTFTGTGFGTTPASAVISNANRIRASSSLGSFTDLYMGSTAPGSADYEVQADIYLASLNVNYAAVCARAAGGTSPVRYKFGYIAGSPGVWALYKYDASNAATQIGSNVTSPTPTATTAFTLKLRVQGTAITGFVNGTQVITATDSTISATGLPAIELFASSTDTTGAHITNVSAQSIASGLAAGAPAATTPYLNTVTLTETPSGGTTPYSYQWKRSTDGTTFSNVSGATSATFSPTETSGSTLWYDCLVTDSASGTATSSAMKVQFPTKLIIIDGDSIGVGYPSVADAGLYHAPSTLCTAADNSNALSQMLGFLNPAQTSSFVGGDWCAYNVGYTSRPLASTTSDTNATGHTQQGDYTTNVHGKITAAVTAGASKIVVVSVGEPTNLLFYCTLNSGAGGTLAQNAATSALQTYANGVRSDGAIFVTHTMLGRNQTASDAAFDADRLAVNAWMRANWRSQLWGALADIANDIRFGPVPPGGSSTYFADGIHPSTPTGYGELARYLAGAVLEAVSSANTGGGAGGINGSEILAMA